jgi:aryl-alcohol dehydrogenase-like predicted oxidoreductase
LSPAERDRVVISTKTLVVEAGQRRSPEQVVASLHASLKRLKTDRVEVFICTRWRQSMWTTPSKSSRPPC